MYNKLKDMVIGTGSFIAQQGSLYKNFMGSHMKYHFIEHDTYREILKTREELKNAYVKAEKSLNDKKERLFKNKDFSKWGYQGPVEDI